MVKLSDLALVFGAILVLGSVVFASGNVQLPGSNALDNIFTDPSVEPTQKYELTTKVEVGPEGLKDAVGNAYGFQYKTIEDNSFFMSLPIIGDLSFYTGAKDVTVEYVLTKDGRVIDSEAKRLGKISLGSTKHVTFDTPNLESGSYKVRYLSDFKRCILGVCSGAGDKTGYNVDVPKLPLGEY